MDIVAKAAFGSYTPTFMAEFLQFITILLSWVTAITGTVTLVYGGGAQVCTMASPRPSKPLCPGSSPPHSPKSQGTRRCLPKLAVPTQVVALGAPVAAVISGGVLADAIANPPGVGDVPAHLELAGNLLWAAGESTINYITSDGAQDEEEVKRADAVMGSMPAFAPMLHLSNTMDSNASAHEDPFAASLAFLLAGGNGKPDGLANDNHTRVAILHMTPMYCRNWAECSPFRPKNASNISGPLNADLPDLDPMALLGQMSEGIVISRDLPPLEDDSAPPLEDDFPQSVGAEAPEMLGAAAEMSANGGVALGAAGGIVIAGTVGPAAQEARPPPTPSTYALH